MKNFGFGFMRLPMQDGEVDIEQTIAMVDRFMEAGFTYFDTAHGYLGGKSELALKAALTSRYPRESYVIADKLSPFRLESEEQIEPTFKDELSACGVAYFDYFLMHSMNTDYYETYVKFHAFEHAAKWKADGKIKHLGISFHDTADVLERILTEQPSIEFVQLQINYTDVDDEKIQGRACLDVCEKFGKPVIVMEPVKGGRLADLPAEAEKVLTDRGASPASFALRYAASQKGVFMVLSGMSTLEQVEENIAVMRDFSPLTEEEYEAVERAKEILFSQKQIACTACKYCTEVCPQKVTIPGILECLNSHYRHPRWDGTSLYEVRTKYGAPASACIDCGACENACPQQLPIRELLKEAVEVFEK